MSNDFEAMFRKVVAGEQAYTKRQQTKAMVLRHISALYNTIFTVMVFAGMLMLGNMAVNRAWSNLDAFRPGIGWWDSCIISLMLLFLYAVKLTIAANGRGRE